MKFLLQTFEVYQFKILLLPTKILVEFLTGAHSVFTPNSGYYFPELSMVIDKSCAGYNLWLLFFVLISFLIVKYSKTKKMMFFAIPISLVSGLVLTYFVNASRIFTSVVFQEKIEDWTSLSGRLVHESIGVLFNLFFLILVYLLVEKRFNPTGKYEKSE